MTILAAVGEKQRSRRLVRTAHELATAYGDELVVLHVIPQDEAEAHFKELRKIPEFRDMTLSAEADRAEQIARAIIDDSLDDYDRDLVRAQGRLGDPTEAILDMAEGLEARYIVMGGKKRSPTGKALFGSVTQSVLLNAGVPTVTVIEGS